MVRKPMLIKIIKRTVYGLIITLALYGMGVAWNFVFGAEKGPSGKDTGYQFELPSGYKGAANLTPLGAGTDDQVYLTADELDSYLKAVGRTDIAVPTVEELAQALEASFNSLADNVSVLEDGQFSRTGGADSEKDLADLSDTALEIVILDKIAQNLANSLNSLQTLSFEDDKLKAYQEELSQYTSGILSVVNSARTALENNEITSVRYFKPLASVAVDPPPPPPDIDDGDISDDLQEVIDQISDLIDTVKELIDLINSDLIDLLRKLLEGALSRNDLNAFFDKLQKHELANIEAAREDVNKLINEVMLELKEQPLLIDSLEFGTLLRSKGITRIVADDAVCGAFGFRVNDECVQIRKEGRIIVNPDDYLFEEPLQKARHFAYCFFAPWRHFPFGDEYTPGLGIENRAQDIADLIASGSNNVCPEPSFTQPLTSDDYKKFHVRADIPTDAYGCDPRETTNCVNKCSSAYICRRMAENAGGDPFSDQLCQSDQIRNIMRQSLLNGLARKKNKVVNSPPYTWYTKNRCEVLLGTFVNTTNAVGAILRNTEKSLGDESAIAQVQPNLEMSLGFKVDWDWGEFLKAFDPKNQPASVFSYAQSAVQSIVQDYKKNREVQFIAGQGLRPAQYIIGLKDYKPERYKEYLQWLYARECRGEDLPAGEGTPVNTSSCPDYPGGKPPPDGDYYFFTTEDIIAPAVILREKIAAAMQAQFDLTQKAFKLNPSPEHILPSTREICPGGWIFNSESDTYACKKGIFNRDIGKLPAPFEDEANYADLSKAAPEYLKYVNQGLLEPGTRAPGRLREYNYPDTVYGSGRGSLDEIVPPGGTPRVPGQKATVIRLRDKATINNYFRDVAQLYDQPLSKVLKEWFESDLCRAFYRSKGACEADSANVGRDPIQGYIGATTCKWTVVNNYADPDYPGYCSGDPFQVITNN